jgi:hypothetical protein
MRKTVEREQNRTEQISENENKKMFCVLPDYQPKVWSNSEIEENTFGKYKLVWRVWNLSKKAKKENNLIAKIER